MWPRLTNRTDAAAAAAVALAVEIVRRAASKPCSGPKERQGQPPRPASVCCVPTVLSQELTAHVWAVRLAGGEAVREQFRRSLAGDDAAGYFARDGALAEGPGRRR